MTVHTIFVPKGMSVEQVWESIKRGAPVDIDDPKTGTWVNVNDKGKVI